MLVYLVVFDKTSFGLSQKLFNSIDEYIEEHYVEEVEITFHHRQDRFTMEQLQEPEATSEDFYEKQSEIIIDGQGTLRHYNRWNGKCQS